MDHIGIDLHKNASQVCILTEDDELIERRIKTGRESFDELFSERPPARILVEASTESEWAARHFEALGHEVIVADPNFAPMYATRDRRIKTDKRDARALGGGLVTLGNQFSRKIWWWTDSAGAKSCAVFQSPT